MRGRAAWLLGALSASTALAQPAGPAVDPPPVKPAGGETRPNVIAVELHLPPGTSVSPAVRVDVRAGRPLSPREVRRSLLRLYGTGEYASATARAIPAPGGVRVVFELVPKRLVNQVTVEGNRAFPMSQVLEASGISVKSEYSEDLLRRASERIAEFYRRRGYDQASVSEDVVELAEGLSVAFTVSEAEPTRVRRVTVTGEPGLPLQRILDVAGLRVGGVLDRAALAESLEKLRGEYRSERYYRAQVGEPAVALVSPHASLALPIRSGPRYTLHFRQNHQIPDGVLRAVLAYDGKEVLDQSLTGRLARRLQAYYQARGFAEARVRARELPSLDRRSAVLSFEIEEGPRLQVKELAFTGNHHFSTSELRQQVRAAVRRREPVLQGVRADDTLQAEGRVVKEGLEVPALDPEQVYAEEAFREAGATITELYRNRGFLTARVRPAGVVIDVSRRSARVRFTVQEGPRTRVSSIGVEGLPPGVEAPAEHSLRKDDPVNVSLLEQGRRELLQRLARAGHLFARVEPESHLSPDGSETAITYRVDAGPRVTVGQVSLSGAERSDRQVVLDNVPLKPGDVMDPELILEGQRALVRLGGYRQVTVRLDQPELVEPHKDIQVNLAERPLTEGEVGLGYSGVDGPRLLLDAAFPNLLGQALNLDVRAKVHWIGAYQAFAGGFGLTDGDPRDFAQPSAWYGLGGKSTVSLRMPRVRYFIPASIGAHLDLIGEREFRPSFQFGTVAGIAGLDWRATGWLTASIQYNVELDRVCTYQLRGRRGEPFDCGTGGLADLSGQDRRFFQFGSFLLQAVAPTLTVDLRDDPANPTRGLVLSGSGEITSSLDARYSLLGVKAQGNLTGYLPLWPRAVLAASLRGGRFFPLTSGQDPLPVPKRFYLGGFTTLRGFTEDGVLPADTRAGLRLDRLSCAALVSTAGCTRAALALLGGAQIPSEGGELYALGRLELRLPFQGPLDLGLFFEVGNLWSDASGYQPFDLRPVAGAGVRLETPIGPLAADVGFNLAPDLAVNEQAFNFHFNIGLF